MSRLIVKNIPKQIAESELKAHFEKQGGQITDCRIMFKEKKNRRIAFIGYKSEADAAKAKEYFNNSYIYMSRVSVDFAKTNDDPSLPQAWSKYSKARTGADPAEQKAKARIEETKTKEEGKPQVSAEKRAKFAEFLQLMRKTQNQPISEAVPEEAAEKPRKRLKKNETKINGNTVIVTELDPATLKAGVSAKRVHIKLAPEPEKHRISALMQASGSPSGQTKPPSQPKEEVKSAVLDEKRLYVLNLPFNSTEEEIREVFSRFGKVTELKLPKDKEGKFKGFAYVSYETDTEALHCFSQLDNRIVMGRILHIRPAYANERSSVSRPIDNNQGQGAGSDEKTSFKRSKKVH